MITNPKTFFEQFQNFIEESGLQLKKFKSNLSNYFTKSEAIDTFLGKTDQAESAKKADEATKATQDAKGNVIDSTYLTKSAAASTYLTKDGKVASAANADTATKASQDSSGNEFTTTYLKKADAESTYLGKTAKAESAKSADAATKAIQDDSGNVITASYAASLEGDGTDTLTLKSKSGAELSKITVNNVAKATSADSATTAGTCTGNSATATKATQDGSGNTITSTYAKLSGATFTGAVKATSFQATSDKRFKFNIESYKPTNALTRVNSINLYKYNLQNDEYEGKRLGVIAQELKEIVPELVKEDKNGYYSVDYAGLTALNSAAINQLTTRILFLENQINELINKD